MFGPQNNPPFWRGYFIDRLKRGLFRGPFYREVEKTKQSSAHNNAPFRGVILRAAHILKKGIGVYFASDPSCANPDIFSFTTHMCQWFR